MLIKYASGKFSLDLIIINSSVHFYLYLKMVSKYSALVSCIIVLYSKTPLSRNLGERK